GSAVVGSTLTAARGSWSGRPSSYHYAWARCTARGKSCAKVRGATSKKLALKAGDARRTVRVLVVASNADGPTTAQSAAITVAATATAPSAGSKPHNTSPPTISGSPVVGQTLTASPGSWTGGSMSYTYN